MQLLLHAQESIKLTDQFTKKILFLPTLEKSKLLLCLVPVHICALCTDEASLCGLMSYMTSQYGDESPAECNHL